MVNSGIETSGVDDEDSRRLGDEGNRNIRANVQQARNHHQGLGFLVLDPEYRKNQNPKAK